nr:hypothetical protein CFP56_34174 [Quercus suber]
MVLLVSYSTHACFSSLSTSSSSSSSSPYSVLPITTNPVSRLLMNPIDQHAKSFDGACTYAPIMTKKRAGTIAKVSSEIRDGVNLQTTKLEISAPANPSDIFFPFAQSLKCL